MERFITVPDASHRWHIDPQLLRAQCDAGQIDGARRIGSIWLLPADQRPIDSRLS